MHPVPIRNLFKVTHTDLDSKTSLTFHIIGASHDVELWGSFHTKNHSSCEDLYDAYAEALHELVSDLKRGFEH